MNSARRGFTLIEILISIAIIFLLTGLTLTGYGAFNKKQTVKSAAHQLAGDLRLVQQKAVSGEKPAGCAGDLKSWQIIIYNNRYRQFAVCNSSIGGDTVYFPTNVTSLSATITFAAITGSVTAGNGTYTITGNFSGTTYTNTIVITPSGGISVQ